MAHLRHLIGLAFYAFLSVIGFAQTPEQLAKLDPGELYYQAWSLGKDAEDHLKDGEFVEAFTKYRKARTFFDIIKVSQPDYKPELVQDKIDQTTSEMEKIHDRALNQQNQRQQTNASSLIEMPGQAKPKISIPEQVDDNNPRAQRIQTLRNELNKLNAVLRNYPNPRDAQAARMRGQIQQYQTELANLTAAPLIEDVAELKRQIAKLRRERDAMAAARDQAVAAQLKTLRELEKTQVELAKSRKEEERLLGIIEKQTELNGQVVAGQQDQIKALRQEMAEKDKTILDFRKKMQVLEVQLQQSNELVEELRKERDTLIQEKSRMAAMLDLNEQDRLQQLITQNVSLSKELNEAKVSLKLVQEDADASKEKILLAKQALTVAKAKIQNLQTENTQATLSLNRMKERLEQSEQDLLAQLNGGELNERGQLEVAMLRKVITKLKAKIAAQEGAASLLIEQANRMGADDQIMKQAMALVTGDEKMMLTHEEERLLSLTPGAVNFKSSLRPTPEELTNATNRLQQFNQDLTGVAHRSFAKGDFQATRGILEIIIDEDPGAWEAMVNLGIVHMKLDNHFDAAKHFRQSILVAGDRKVPFAHFMLGDVLYRSEILDESEIELQKSLALEPDNAKAHVILGNISGTKNQMEDAEFHFKEAILQDPNLFEPYVNLAIIYLQQGKIEEAKTNYTESLRKGGPTRPALAERLGI